MKWLTGYSKKREVAKGFSNQQSRQTAQTFILEPILTPSGILDGGDDTPDPLMVDWETNTLPEVDTVDNDVAQSDISETNDDLDADINQDEIANNTLETDISDEDLETVDFIENLGNPESEGEEVPAQEAAESEILPGDSPQETDDFDVEVSANTNNADVEQADNTEIEITNTSDTNIDEIDETNLQPVTETEIEINEDLSVSDSANEVNEIDNTLAGGQTDETPEIIVDDLSFSEPNFAYDSGVFTVGETGEVGIDFLFDGGKYKGELAIFSLEGMDEFEPGSQEFIQEATSRALSSSELGYVVISDASEGAKFSGNLGENNFNSGTYSGVKTFAMRSGDTFAVMLVPNGKVEQVFNNPSVGGALRPLFSLVTSNPNDAFHVGQIADVTGDGNTFVMEDVRVDSGSDRDYNDIIFQVRGATANATHLDDVINPAKDWRTSDLGQALIAYAEPYIEPEIVDDLELIEEEIPFDDDLNLPDEVIENSVDESLPPIDNQEVSDLPTNETVVEEPQEVDDESTDEKVIVDKSEVYDESTNEKIVAENPNVSDEEVVANSTDSQIDKKEIIFSSPADKSSTDEVSVADEDVVSDELANDRILESISPASANNENEEVREIADSEIITKPIDVEEVVSKEENAIASPTITTTQPKTEVAEIKPAITVNNSSPTVVEKVSVENVSTSTFTPVVAETKNVDSVGELKADSSIVKTVKTGNGGSQTNVINSDVVVTESKIASNSPITSTAETTTAVTVTETQNTAVILPRPAVSAKPPIQFEFPQENQPLVGIIDKGFSANNPDINYSRIILGQDRMDGDANPLVVAGEGDTSGTSTLGIIGATQNNQIGINGINDDAPLWVGRAEVNSDQWAESLMEFVDQAKKSKQPNAVVNLSFNLANSDGTPRFELTGAERAALAYAQHNNVLIVASAGDNPGQMSALGKAGLEFDNIITVGAAERVNNAVALSKAFAGADYSGSGAGLDIVADGGSADKPITVTSGEGTAKEFGTSVATAKVTGAVSQVWAANPKLNFTQVIDILKRTATDLGKPNWDAQTGAGLLNITAAVSLAKATKPELLPVEPPKDDEPEEPEVQEPVIKITPEMGFLPEPIKLTDDIWFLGGPSPDKLNLIGGFSNRNAADTTNADQLWSGGGLGLNLNGSGVTVGVWDGGKVRNTHQEFGSRVVISDSASSFSDHATHVAGTIGATGVNSEARGMANQVNIRSYDWNNHLQELEAAAKTGLTLSNHSYGSIIGWASYDWSAIGVYGPIDSWFGDRARFSEAEGFGKYGQGSNELDRILYNNPNLLSVWASGNDRGGSFGNQSGNNTYLSYFSSNPGNIPNWQGQGWYRIPNSGVTTAPGKDGGNTGYDTLSSDGAVAKNTLVVGAINAITADPYNNSNVVMSSFSNWGPTDDGRLKVDVVGNGVGVYSTLASSNTAYASYSGTSMATPNVTGTATLLTQHYKNLYGTSPRSATLKGVITHTAFDAGNKGPDYTYGWGVVDGAAAATFLTNAKNQVSDRLIENTYTGSQQSYQITSNGSGSIKATLVWTDPPGNAHGNGLDEKTRVLVNDLDLSITAPNGQVFYPWTLDPNNPSAPAVRTTRNHVDNIEQVLIDTPMPGTYTINVNHSGNSFTQAYSLLVSGISKPLENPIGRGSRAPNLFIDAYNRVNGQGRGLKAQGDAYRWGNGWTQRFLDSNNNEVLIMLEDGQNQAYVVWGEILKEYKNVGGPVGANLPGGGWAYLGYPRSDEKGGTSSKGSPLAIQEFAAENGKARLYYHWKDGNRVATWGSIGAFYMNIGGHNHWLGAPTKREYIDGDTIFADFEGGRIGFRISDGKAEALLPGQQPSWRQRPSWEIAIDQAYSASPVNLGSPLSGYLDATRSPQGTTGKYRVYQNGTIHWTPQYGAVALWLDLQREYGEYSSPNGSGGWLGFPTKQEYPWNGGMRTDFEGGYIFWNGRAKAYRPWESPTPATNSNIRLVNFSGTVGPSIGVNLRNSPRFSDRSSRNEPNGKRLEFDAWTYGEVGTDMWLGTPDARWFRVKGTNLWVPSAYINGNPPNSSPMPGGGTTPLPPSNTKLTQLLNGQLTGRYIDVDGYYGAQCWDLVAYVTGQTGLTTNWQRGTNVMSSGNIPIGTAIATFLGPNGSYDTPGAANQHTGIFAGYGTQNGVSGFYVWDQNWLRGPVQKHFIRTGGSGTSNASNYHVIRF